MTTTQATSTAETPRTKSRSTAITVAQGDGIGPEIMQASLRILREAGAYLDVEPIEIGEAVYRRGVRSGIDQSSWDSLRRTGVFFKAPVTTPQGAGFKSLNVTVRKTLGLFANVRPTVAYHPFVRTKHPRMDVVIIRENEEDLYAGIEHRQTDEVYQCLKLITRPGSEKIVRYAFDYARRNGRRKVSCFTKDNIMKMTDGLFHRVFDEVAAEYPDLESEHRIVDIGAALLADRPTDFDVIVLPNLYGDILSDVAAQLAGSVGLSGSANIGDHIAMFEAIHGSAPDIAGKDVANPSGLLQAGVMMLVHLEQYEAATRVHNALLRTLEDGIHTPDVYDSAQSSVRATTTEFAHAVMARLGQRPERLRPASYQPSPRTQASVGFIRRVPAVKDIVGVDVFLQWTGGTPDELASRLAPAATATLPLVMITNRGVKVWPQGFPETFCTDHWRCRFQSDSAISHRDILTLLERVAAQRLDFIKTENLCTFDGEPGYSLGQGQ
jgi:isocitrate dehydrogenase